MHVALFQSPKLLAIVVIVSQGSRPLEGSELHVARSVCCHEAMFFFLIFQGMMPGVIPGGPQPGYGGGGSPYGVPPPTGGYGAPPPAGGYGAPPPASGYGAPPPASGYGAPPPASGYGAPPPASGYGAPPPASGYGAPPHSGGYGVHHQPPQQSYSPSQGIGLLIFVDLLIFKSIDNRWVWGRCLMKQKGAASDLRR